MDPLTLDGRQTVIVAILAMYLGKLVNSKVEFLRHYHIPDAVTGGVVASILFGLIYGLADLQFKFSLHLRDELLLVFFA